MQRYAACSAVSRRALVCLCVRVCHLVRPGLRVIFVMQARLRLTDVCAELKSIFTCHGALEYEASVLAPKPAKPSKSTMSELRLLHAPAVTSSDGHDLICSLTCSATPNVFTPPQHRPETRQCDEPIKTWAHDTPLNGPVLTMPCATLHDAR